MIRLLVIVALLGPTLLSLAACGKVGPNSLPGPADQEIIHRLPYPAQ
jgi:predicted small lipoprotein YifL